MVRPSQHPPEPHPTLTCVAAHPLPTPTIMDHHPLQPNQSLIANLRSLTESEKWPEFDALEAEFSRSFAAGSEDARQLDEHDSLMLIMRDAEAGMHRALRTKTRWAAVEMARVKRVQVQADALMAEAKVMRDEAGREMKRAREVEDQGESDIARLEEVVASIKGRLGRIARERERRRLAQERRFKAAVGRLWQTVEVDEGQRVRPAVGETRAPLQSLARPKREKPQRPAQLLLSSPFSLRRSGSSGQDCSEEKKSLPTRNRPIGALSISQLLVDPKEEGTQLPMPEVCGQFCWPPPCQGPKSARADAKSSPPCLVSPPNHTAWHQYQPVHPQFQQETTPRKRRAVECVSQLEANAAVTVPQLSIPSGASTRSFSTASCSPLSTSSSLSHIPTALRLPPPTRSFPLTIQPSPPIFLPHVPPAAQQQPTGQVPFKRKHNTKPPLPLSHKQPKPPTPTTTSTTHAPAHERWDASWLTPEPGLLGSVSWEQFRSDGSRYPLSKRWLCQRRPRVKGCRAPPRWLVFKCPAHPARVMDSQKELEKHYARDHADVATPAQRLRECGVHVRGCRQSLASSHNASITRDTYAMDWGSEGPVSGGEGRQGGRERVGRAVSEPAVDAWESCALWEGCDRDARSA
ncbi:hypothetical protein MGG_02592 [Pyricularia oryzae 70-15]|uniref:Uncharacterized protein n=1 Tax=Pyricularia oryzae (strain 70-15 / ATCC MYA-4617 / FGSC 8958) TaxID=242507 RepID=G4NJT6_PYRO7|nr:uncharacterized protein MGG_02592 [Pyricularia oryzae 70-15]EHA46465.1 hypothetical protein MGG_02592 [Pyricularia oryzae 70-15]